MYGFNLKQHEMVTLVMMGKINVPRPTFEKLTGPYKYYFNLLEIQKMDGIKLSHPAMAHCLDAKVQAQVIITDITENSLTIEVVFFDLATKNY